jgi:hypothetical protein
MQHLEGGTRAEITRGYRAIAICFEESMAVAWSANECGVEGDAMMGWCRV